MLVYALVFVIRRVVILQSSGKRATMRFETSLVPGVLISRYKRFFADVQLADGTQVTAHAANSGSMLGCSTPGSPVLLLPVHNPARKLAYTWELIQVGSSWVGVNTQRPNRLVEEAIVNGTLVELGGWENLRREVAYGHERSRADLVLTTGNKRCVVEVKGVSLAMGNRALFPDAVTTRGTRHLRELLAEVEGGGEAALVFAVMRGDVEEVRPADEIDPEYGQTLRRAARGGVKILAYRAELTAEEISLTTPLPVVW